MPAGKFQEKNKKKKNLAALKSRKKKVRPRIWSGSGAVSVSQRYGRIRGLVYDAICYKEIFCVAATRIEAREREVRRGGRDGEDARRAAPEGAGTHWAQEEGTAGPAGGTEGHPQTAPGESRTVNNSVSDPGSRSEFFFIPDPNFSIPDPHQRI